MERNLTAPGRVASVLLIAVLVGPTVAWWHHVVRMTTGCAGGYGNHRVTGELESASCTLSVAGAPVYRLGWLADLVTAAGLLLALLAAVLVLVQPARSALRAELALLPVPTLALAALLIREDGWAPPGIVRMTAGFLAEHAAAAEPPVDTPLVHTYGAEPYAAGWRIRVPGAGIFVPTPGLMWIFAVFVAVLLALGLALVVWRARFRPGPERLTARRPPGWSGSPR
ncbi:hypothetical protein [Saccharopolyspora griseoalba]|uniref:Uncharacterized protein n=1 Tax=Saccharopolyspora griseoalba TaxID=1431848 RepID=A0ABW2LNA7_9PSEU